LSEVEECYKDNARIFVKGLDCIGEGDAYETSNFNY